jgi:hypothetical protein
MTLRNICLAAALALPSAAAAGNLETTQALYAAFGSGDIPAILDRLAPDVRWDHGYEGTEIPSLVPRTGPREVGAFFEGLAELEFTRFDVLNMLEGGDQVAVVVDLAATVKDTGRSVDDIELHLWTFGADGQVTEFRHFVDGEEFLAAFR